MILQQLVKDYERIQNYDHDSSEEGEENEETEDEETGEAQVALPSMYDYKPVRWKILLAKDGEFRGLIPLTGGGPKDRGKSMPVPSLVRTSGVRPLLLADTPAYVLGVDIPDKAGKSDKNTEKKHEAFREMIVQCAKSIDAPWMNAVSKFLETDIEAAREAASTDKVSKDDLLTFDVEGIWPIDQLAVRTYWAAQCGVEAKQSEPMSCLVCGQQRPAVESMPFNIKGLPGGQSSGTALVSANSTVYESYGLKRATTSPICASCAERFNKSLQALIRCRRTRIRIGKLMYVFWTAEQAQDLTWDLLNAPEPEDVRALFQMLDGIPRELETAAFYGIALSANMARAVVRDWIATTVGTVYRNLGRWLKWQQISDPYGAEGLPLPIWKLAACLYRKKSDGRLNTDDVETRVSEALVQSALHGDPIPMDLLHRSVLRNRADRDVSYERAALMAAVLLSRKEIEEQDLDKTEEQMVTQFKQEGQEMTNEIRARLCGQLLAVLEETQRQFAQADNRSLNTTLVDRYYGTASSAPATVFGTLLSDTQAHLSKLRKVRPGTYTNLQKRLEEVLSALDTFPTTLNLKQQALFSLGYYKQRAEQRKAGIEAAQLKRAQAGHKTEAADDTTETTEENE